MSTVHQAHLFDSGVDEFQEHPAYLSRQIITYLGNKRSLLPFIGRAIRLVKDRLRKDRLEIFEPFTGSGVVARYMKRHASRLIVNDLEDYTVPLGKCYLANRDDVDHAAILAYNRQLALLLESPTALEAGFVSELYAPRDESAIERGERVFYTPNNARRIDTARQFIDTIPDDLQPFLLAPLLAAASVHANTAGVFKGFYKDAVGIGKYGGRGANALTRICAPINVPIPIFSRFRSTVDIRQGDANAIARLLPEIDLAYLDPPYNQHPYGSNYFMLNLIANYCRPADVSRVAGIPRDWRRSRYNKRPHARAAFWDLVTQIRAKYMIISYNAEGFIAIDDMVDMLRSIGRLSVFEKQYNTFRACRNLAGRPLHVTEYLFLVEVT